MTIIQKQARQGDILLRKMTLMQANLIEQLMDYGECEKIVDSNHPGEAVLAYGETHGHRHTIKGAELMAVKDDAQSSLGELEFIPEYITSNDFKFVVVDEISNLEHLTETEEPTRDHDTITNVAPGMYWVVGQFEDDNVGLKESPEWQRRRVFD